MRTREFCGKLLASVEIIDEIVTMIYLDDGHQEREAKHVMRLHTLTRKLKHDISAANAAFFASDPDSASGGTSRFVSYGNPGGGSPAEEARPQGGPSDVHPKHDGDDFGLPEQRPGDPPGNAGAGAVDPWEGGERQ